MLDKEKAYELVGKPFERFKDGKAWGCMSPLYAINNEFKEYYTLEDTEHFLEYARKNFKEVPLEDIQYGDTAVLLLPKGVWHIMVYMGGGNYMHCMRNTGNVIEPMPNYFKSRLKGVFRWQQPQ